jgi:hypothetical protein
VVFRPWGRHRFGGRPDIRFEGTPPPAPIHHIFTLDTQDRRSPIRFEGVRYVPLIYPLAYSSGGGQVAYRVVGDMKVQVIRLTEYDPEEPPYFLLDALPERRCSLKPLTYAERRIAKSRISDRSLLDRWRMRRLWNGECFEVAGIMDYRPNIWDVPCPSPANSNGDRCSAWTFAIFPASKVPFGDIWHEYSYTVWFCFAICFRCGLIHAFNTCD